MKKHAVLWAAAALVSSASASTVSFTFSNPGTPVFGVQPGTTQTGNLGLFDSNLGTLRGATLRVTGSATAVFGIANVSGVEQTVALTHFTDLVWSSSLAVLEPYLADLMSLTFSSGSLLYGPGQARTFGPIDGLDAFEDDLAPVLGALQAAGGGAFAVDCRRWAGLRVMGGGANPFDVLAITDNAAISGCSASIAYTYDPAPPAGVAEPASGTLAGLALAGLAAVRRRRRV